MNKIYRTVYNAATGTYVVASELAKGRTKSSKTAVALAVAAALALPGGIARAGTNKEEDAVEQEIAMVNAAPNSTGTNSIGTMSGGMGTMATATQLDQYVAFGNVYGGVGTVEGVATAALGGTAMGRYARAGQISSAFGDNATATGANATAIGFQAEAAGNNNTAVGMRAYANVRGSATPGTNNTAIGTNVLIGTDAAGTSASSATAVGANARITASNGVALGRNASVGDAGTNSVALGTGSIANEADTVSVGNTNAGGQRRIVNMAAGMADTDAVNVGQMKTALSTKVDNTLVQVGGTTAAMVSGNAANIAIGNGAQSTSAGGGSASIAFGNDARAIGNNGSIAFGNASRATGASSAALGVRATVDADATGSQAFGTDASVRGYRDDPTTPTVTHTASNSIAIGSGASVAATATADANNSVAMGNRASVTASNAVALGAGSTATEVNTVSVGNAAAGGQRRIVNMAAGVADNDAVNVGQMKTALATKLDNTLIKVNGTTAATVGADDRSVAIGSGASALYGEDLSSGLKAGGVAMGNLASATGGGVAVGDTARAGTFGAAFGASSNAAGVFSTAVGTNSSATGSNAVALGYRTQAQAAGSVALGDSSVADREDTVSVGKAGVGGFTRQIANVGAGTRATDAVNVGQLSPVVNALGGGAAIDPTTGAVTGPTYTLANGGTRPRLVGRWVRSMAR
ncbi:ESPR-type extended signal peptide-containing protein [Ralstonia insidiosa]|uniref:ESPR-type extended signal peptide-containing protein n=2 Tax=Ralstonia TaxID=48736 RepID=UPI00069D9F22|nr:ESPR-type extended signal peptide-containing protein [Ralstonia insidiosa]